MSMFIINMYLSKKLTAQSANQQTNSMELSHARKLIVADLHTKSPALYGIHRFVTAFTKLIYGSVSVHSMPSHFTF
jgi:hypothetical protein